MLFRKNKFTLSHLQTEPLPISGMELYGFAKVTCPLPLNVLPISIQDQQSTCRPIVRKLALVVIASLKQKQKHQEPGKSLL